MRDKLDIQSFQFVITSKKKRTIHDGCMRVKHLDRYLNVTTYRFVQTVQYFNWTLDMYVSMFMIEKNIIYYPHYH